MGVTCSTSFDPPVLVPKDQRRFGNHLSRVGTAFGSDTITAVTAISNSGGLLVSDSRCNPSRASGEERSDDEEDVMVMQQWIDRDEMHAAHTTRHEPLRMMDGEVIALVQSTTFGASPSVAMHAADSFVYPLTLRRRRSPSPTASSDGSKVLGDQSLDASYSDSQMGMRSSINVLEGVVRDDHPHRDDDDPLGGGVGRGSGGRAVDLSQSQQLPLVLVPMNPKVSSAMPQKCSFTNLLGDTQMQVDCN